MVLLGRQMEVAYLIFEHWLVTQEIKKNSESLVTPEQQENLTEIEHCLAANGYKILNLEIEQI